MSKGIISFYLSEDGKVEPKKICYFTTKDYTEYVKLMCLCKKYDIELWLRSDDENIADEFKNRGLCYMVDGISVNFGGDDCINPSIDIYLK